MPDYSSSLYKLPTVLFLALLGGTEIMSLLSMTDILTVPGVRWDIMPALCSVLTMLSCILSLTSTPQQGPSRSRRNSLISFISIGALALILANMGLRPWAPSLLYSTLGLAIGIAAFIASYKGILKPRLNENNRRE